MSRKEDGTELLEIEQDLRERLRIDPLALEQEFITCPGNIAYLGAKHGAAIRDHLRAEIRRKKLWGLLLIQAREELESLQQEAQTKENLAASVGDRKTKDVKVRVTESMVESHAQQLAAWQRAQEEEIEAEVTREVARTNLAAMLAKKDMLVQMGANQRAEMERDPTIRNTVMMRRSMGTASED